VGRSRRMGMNQRKMQVLNFVSKFSWFTRKGLKTNEIVVEVSYGWPIISLQLPKMGEPLTRASGSPKTTKEQLKNWYFIVCVVISAIIIDWEVPTGPFSNLLPVYKPVGRRAESLYAVQVIWGSRYVSEWHVVGTHHEQCDLMLYCPEKSWIECESW
jgi:hypothetical protein